MKRYSKLLLIFFLISLSFSACGKVEENIRDMSEVASAGSFVMSMEGQESLILDEDMTYVFNDYSEFIGNSLSETITYSMYYTIDGKNTLFEYMAKNERYNEDYFIDNDLMVKFFGASSDVSEFIVNNVEFSAKECVISLVGTFSSLDMDNRSDDNELYACFIEYSELDNDITASVNIEDFYTSESTLNHYIESGATFKNLDNDDIIAYYIDDSNALESFIADNENINDDILSFSLKASFDDTFFNSASLMFLQVPGAYYAHTSLEGNILQGIYLESEHYMTLSESEMEENHLSNTGLIAIKASKNLEYETLEYSHTSFSEWEEGSMSALKEESAIFTLNKVDSEVYTVYKNI